MRIEGCAVGFDGGGGERLGDTGVEIPREIERRIDEILNREPDINTRCIRSVNEVYKGNDSSLHGHRYLVITDTTDLSKYLAIQKLGGGTSGSGVRPATSSSVKAMVTSRRSN